jgi:hypothetical protein
LSIEICPSFGPYWAGEGLSTRKENSPMHDRKNFPLGITEYRTGAGGLLPGISRGLHPNHEDGHEEEEEGHNETNPEIMFSLSIFHKSTTFAKTYISFGLQKKTIFGDIIFQISTSCCKLLK